MYGRINLIPKEMRPPLIDVSPRAQILSLILIPSIYIASMWIITNSVAKNLRSELLSLQRKDQQLATDIAQLSSAQSGPAKQTRQLNSITSLLAKKVRWADVYKELSVLMPSGVWLRELKSSSINGIRQLTIVGSAPSQEKVAHFFSVLEQSYFFKKVRIIVSEKEKGYRPELYKFEFRIPVTDGSG